MTAIFIHYNSDGTIETAALRHDGRKIAGYDNWELYEMVQFLSAVGRKSIEISKPDGGWISVTVY